MPDCSIRFPFQAVRSNGGLPEIRDIFMQALVNNDGTPILRRSISDTSHGAVPDFEDIELEIEADLFGDENIEPLKLTVCVPESTLARVNHVAWRDDLAAVLAGRIGSHRYLLERIPTFQITIIIGYHHSGAVYSVEADGSATLGKEWIDDEIPPRRPTPALA